MGILGGFMSDVFKNTIDDEDIFSLEDERIDMHALDADNYVFPSPLYRLKLDYSAESVYATTPDTLMIMAGDAVIIPTRYGKDMAIVLGAVKKPIGTRPSDVVHIERKSTKEDIVKVEEFKRKEKESLRLFSEKANSRNLDMKAVGVHYLLEEQKVVFFFSSDNRVDFRELVKDLVAIFKMRIELRQIGVRDEARIIGGLGVCGRAFCCHAVSDKLRPVSIRMAKNQNLSLNSIKISGQCGRLLCCLSYESDWYTEARKNMPAEGIRIFYDGTNFRITESNPIKSTVRMMGEDGRVLEFPTELFTSVGGKWKLSKDPTKK